MLSMVSQSPGACSDAGLGLEQINPECAICGVFVGRDRKAKTWGTTCCNCDTGIGSGKGEGGRGDMLVSMF